MQLIDHSYNLVLDSLPLKLSPKSILKSEE